MEKKHRIDIPKYSLAEELISSISHGLGAGFGIAALVLCVVKGAVYGGAFEVVSSAVYGGALVVLYTISTLYHALKVNRAKRVMRVIDHCSVYLLIAGTYTPYTLVALRGPVGWVLFGIVWGAAALGIVFNSINIKKYRVISMIAYICMGWVIVFAMKPLFEAVETGGIVLLFTGGVAYTLGAVLYVIGKRVKFMHSVFHFFVLAGSILHFFSVFLYIL